MRSAWTKFPLIGLMLAAFYIGCGQEGEPDLASSSPDSLTVELTAIDSITPLDLLLESHQVEHRSSLIGSFVTTIDAVENSSAAYWIYTVNDTTPKVACDKMTLKPGDRLKWHYRKVTPTADDSNSTN
jgi:hypothetical protein